MAKQGGAGLGTYIIGAAVLWFVFGGDDKADTNNVSSQTTTPVVETTAPTKPKTTTVTVKKQSETKVVSLPKTVTAKPALQPAVTYKTKTMYVDASRLNVRNQAGKQGKVIWTLKRDQKVQVTNRNGDWLFVESSRFKGWVFGTYLTNNSAPKKISIPKKTQKKTAGLSTARIKKILIKRSHAYYSGNCPCPYNRTSRGHKCGKRSAYSRPGGASPLCYNSDVTARMVADYRARQ